MDMAIRGELTFPGDKSISHRALMLAALCEGESRLSNLSTGSDVTSTRNCLRSCGIEIQEDAQDVLVKGGRLSSPDTPLDCGNSGTTARLTMGLLAGQGISATFIGDASLTSRPMDRVLHPLSRMGLRASGRNGTLPVTITPSDLKGIHHELPVASAQVKSAILLAGLGAEGVTSVTEPIATRDHTEIMLRELGADISQEDKTISLSKNSSTLPSFSTTVPGDPSAAAFFAAAAALVPGSDISLKSVLANPTRTGFFAALEKMGASMEWPNRWRVRGEPVGDLRVSYKPLRAVSIQRRDVPGLIDEIPILAILATQAEGITEVRGAEELRVKECDRLHAIRANLKRMGAKIEEMRDGIVIQGPSQLRGAKIETFNDHRIAMAFSIAGLIAEGNTTLDNPECAAVSFPGFYASLDRVTR